MATIETQAIQEAKIIEQPLPAAKDTAIPLSPSVRRIVNENTLDPSSITGTGKDGRLTKMDVLDHINKQQTPATPPPSVVTATSDTKQKPLEIIEPSITMSASHRPEQRVPMTRLRAKIAERLLQAQQNAAMLTTFNEVDMQNIIELRNRYKARFEQKHNTKLGFMSFLSRHQ